MRLPCRAALAAGKNQTVFHFVPPDFAIGHKIGRAVGGSTCVPSRYLLLFFDGKVRNIQATMGLADRNSGSGPASE
jgi:hypothetical protein